MKVKFRKCDLSVIGVSWDKGVHETAGRYWFVNFQLYRISLLIGNSEMNIQVGQPNGAEGER